MNFVFRSLQNSAIDFCSVSSKFLLCNSRSVRIFNSSFFDNISSKYSFSLFVSCSFDCKFFDSIYFIN